ncbi:hypothetical protein QBC35DRAFT_438680 [Podospora australis]|uniref:Uncharacterized protein n=1 Tax=Podospora australis TaxID=1536484 RepID=A0AAN6WQY7_9PEZI|nr:hypothetical protein QBC35DRAFT_438680 [Podospora australis]
MDWPAVKDPFLAFQHEYAFEYDAEPTPNLKSRVLQQFDGNDLTSTVLEDDNDWKTWLESSIFQPPPDNPQAPISTKQDYGFCLLLTARVKPIQLGGLGNTESEKLATPIYYLPLSRERWRKITKHFRLHNVICRATYMDRCYATYLVYKGLEMFTAVMNPDWPGNIAISSTHFRDKKLTLAVIYGCSESQMEMVEELLAESPEVRSHPLLTVGVFAELQRDRLEGLIQAAVDVIEDLMIELRIRDDDFNPTKRVLTWATSRQFFVRRASVKALEEEARATQEELKKMIDEINAREESEPPAGQDFATSTRRFVSRLSEICTDLDALMVKCRTAHENVTFTRELFMAEVSRQEAQSASEEAREARRMGKISSRQARVSTVIAFVAMLYLPMTTVATIFAMPVFNFEHHWMDFPDDPNDAVLSAYFWYYLITSFLTTLITYLGWRWYTKEPQESDSGNNVTTNSTPSAGPGTQGMQGYTTSGANGAGDLKTPLISSDDSQSTNRSRHKWSLNPWSWFGIRQSYPDVSKA